MGKRKYLFGALIFILLLVFLWGACAFPFNQPFNQPYNQPAELDTLNEAWGIVFQEYVDKDKLDSEKLSQGAIKGMIEALDDPYSAYLDPETYQLQLKSLKGTYQGIGAHVTMKDGQLIVVAPIADSPAEKAGVRPGDKILNINDESTEGVSLVEAVLKIQGPQGTPVRLTILHEDEVEPVTITITRAEIKIKSVVLEMREDIAYIKLTNFTETTAAELITALQDMPNNTIGIILDLRNNPGGLLQVVVDVAEQFLKEGVVVNVVDNQGRKTTLEVKRGGLATDLPLIVLVNEGSASGSEVLAGAIQDNGRAKLAGKQTFGKGSVNSVLPLKDGSALYLTVARWFTPLDKPIEGVGLTPDYPLELEGDELVSWAIDYLETQVKVKVMAGVGS